MPDIENTEKKEITAKLDDWSDTAFEFMLDKEEVRSALYLVGRLKNRKTRTIVEIVILSVLFIVGLINVIIDYTYTIGYVTMAACLIVGILLILVPQQEEEKTIRDAMKTTNATTIITPMEDKIRIKVPKSGAQWEIVNDSLRGVKQNDIIYVFLIKDGRFLVIPKRVIDTEKKQKAFDIAKDYITKPQIDL